MRTYTFSITFEVPEDISFDQPIRENLLSQMEDLGAKLSLELYDSEIIEEED